MGTPNWIKKLDVKFPVTLRAQFTGLLMHIVRKVLGNFDVGGAVVGTAVEL